MEKTMRNLLMLTSALFLMSGQAFGQNANSTAKLNTKTSKASCATLDEATALLKTFDERETRARIIKDIRANRDEACAKVLSESDDLMSDLLLATVRQNEDAVCEVTKSMRRKELVMRLHKISYDDTDSACKTLKG